MRFRFKMPVAAVAKSGLLAREIKDYADNFRAPNGDDPEMAAALDSLRAGVKNRTKSNHVSFSASESAAEAIVYLADMHADDEIAAHREFWRAVLAVLVSE